MLQQLCLTTVQSMLLLNKWVKEVQEERALLQDSKDSRAPLSIRGLTRLSGIRYTLIHTASQPLRDRYPDTSQRGACWEEKWWILIISQSLGKCILNVYMTVTRSESYTRQCHRNHMVKKNKEKTLLEKVFWNKRNLWRHSHFNDKC